MNGQSIFISRLSLVFAFFILVTYSLQAQTIVNDDYITLLENSAVDFDPTNNDDHADIISLLTVPLHGSIIYLPIEEDLRYTPDAGFFGIDSFQYRGCDDSPPLDCGDAWVYLLITESDLDSLINRTVSAFVEIPLAFYSDDLLPLTDSSSIQFERVFIETAPVLGSAIVDTLNMYLIYTPPSFVGLDSLLIRVCEDDDALICREMLVKVNIVDTCNTDFCVWPGDVDRNGIVDHRDLVGIGWAYNDIGFTRDSVNFSFISQPTSDWESSSSGTNHKFSDCDGDGLVFANDTVGILKNYGLITARNLYSPDTLSFTNIPLQAEVLIDTTLYGDTIKVIIKLGSAGQPGNNVYALTASFSFDYTIFDNLRNISIDFSNSWIASSFDPALHLYRADTITKILDVALTRTDKLGVSGFGEVFTINLITEDNLDQRPESIAFGIYPEVYGPIKDRIRIKPSWFELNFEELNNEPISTALSGIPNPISQGQKVDFSNYKNELSDVMIFDNYGIIQSSNTAELRPGIYLLILEFKNGLRDTFKLIVQ